MKSQRTEAVGPVAIRAERGVRVSIGRKAFVMVISTSLLALAGGAAAASGPVVGWGLVPNITASAIATGLNHGCAIQAGTGAVVCWGGRGT